jgi:soluble lytic murein transglycosylase-like protein
VLENAAAAHDLPLDFFVRLIRQESNFDPNSVSHAGAQGIAQFMPGTARWRGLADPFEPLQVLHQSARWLRELREQFGNLGRAAAAYNAGPRRCSGLACWRWKSAR